MSPIRILLVDDSPEVLEGLRTLLGHQLDLQVVGEASNGLESVAEYFRHQPDVTLMDLRMPGMNGIEAIDAIRRLDPAAKFIVLISYDTRSEVKLAVESGASGLMLKSAPMTEMIDAIRTVHAGNPVFSPELLTLMATGPDLEEDVV